LADPKGVMMSERRYDLDWLRAFAVLLLIPFHAAIVFAPVGDVPIKSLQSTSYLVPFIAFIHTWHMPLLFYENTPQLAAVGMNTITNLRSVSYFQYRWNYEAQAIASIKYDIM